MFLYVDVISTEMTVFSALWVSNTVWASFPDIAAVLEALEKGDGHRRRELKHLKKKSKRRVRKRVSPLREVRAWQPLRHKQIPGELSGPAGRQGAVLCVTCCLRGETDWRYQGAETRYFIFIRCLMSASSRRPLLELRAIEDSCRLPNS